MRKGETSKKAGLIKEGALEFLLSIRESGVTLPKEDEELLIRNGLISLSLPRSRKQGKGMLMLLAQETNLIFNVRLISRLMYPKA